MKTLRATAGAVVLLIALASCSDSSADRDGDGLISKDERAAEMAADAFIPMKPGRWETKFTFTHIDMPTLGKSQRRQIMDELAKGASSSSCLSAEEAKNPGADFFGGEGADKCVYRSFDVSGQNVKMALRCAMEGVGSVDMDLAGAMDQSKFDFDTKMALRLPMIGKVKLKGKAVGIHAGTCTGSE